MKKVFLFLMIAGCLQLDSPAEDPSHLQIVRGQGKVTLKWTNTFPYLHILLTATNLTRPILWSAVTFGAEQWTAPIVYPQQFFRTTQTSLLFQSEIFYNLDLEINPENNTIFNGNVFANGNIWAAGNGNLTFNEAVRTEGVFNHTRSPDDPQTNGVGTIIFNGGQPVTGAPPLDSLNYTNTITNSFQLMIALPPENYRAPNPHAYYPFFGQSYLYNQVDLIITNSANETNIMVLYQNPENTTALSPVPYDVTYITGIGKSKITNAYYSFVTNVSFYDFRESDTVKAIQIDIGKLNAWLMLARGGASYNSQNINSKGYPIDSIYIYNTMPLLETTLPAVRVINGATLPSSGLTIATPQPLYVWGNYNASLSDLGTTNVADTAPTALLCDAITILSTNWKDTYALSTSLDMRHAGSITVNAAILTGIVPSVTVNGIQHYSGGWENFFRLLEDWNGSVLTCNGSFVAGFPSQYATNYWQRSGTYYTIPSRNWNFDLNFTNITKLPPLTPFIANFVTP